MISYWINATNDWINFEFSKDFSDEWLAIYAPINPENLRWNLIETTKKTFYNDGLVQCG